MTAAATRGRPRSERARVAILDAAGELLLRGGLAAATMEAVALRAGVSKATIYKWWPNRGALALDGLLSRVSGTINVPEDATAAESLRFQLHALVRFFSNSPAGPLMRALTAQAESDPELARAIREQWLRPRRAIAADIVRRGIESGEIAAAIDVDAAVDQLFAPVYHRLIYAHDELSETFADSLVAQLFTGIGHFQPHSRGITSHDVQ